MKLLVKRECVEIVCTFIYNCATVLTNAKTIKTNWTLNTKKMASLKRTNKKKNIKDS